MGVAVDERFLASGDEAGTPPGDRRFRPDVEGLRAVAVAFVVLYHAGLPGLTGGFVGVDVFFVISGFVITGLLLRERTATGGTSILDFYARRCRRILPAATLVVLVTVVATYIVLGVVSGRTTAEDARWTSAFLANFHFEWVGTNYFTASRPPSPLQNYWSLSVEEQFYIVYPTLFLLVAAVRTRLSLRTRMAPVLGVVIVVSYGLSCVQTASHPASTYFSPFSRAWELALGALVALGGEWLKQLPARVAAAVSWSGLAAIAYSAVAFTARTPYPGSLVAVPVVGAALVIAGGAANPRSGAEVVLGLGPFRWLGRRSYSLYLWHWPVLVIAAERVGKKSLPVPDDLLLALLALVLAMASYRLVENPIRHWRLPSRRSVIAGVGLVLSTVAVLSTFIAPGSAPAAAVPVVAAADTQVVLRQVAAAPGITTVSKAIAKASYGAAYSWGAATIVGSAYEEHGCWAGLTQARQTICTLGDTRAGRLMVLDGNSRALMWIPTFDAIAKADHWRLVVLAKLGCHAAWVPEPARYRCPQWQRWATRWVERHKPGLVVFSQTDDYTGPSPSSQWRQGLRALFASFRTPRPRMVLLGATPMLSQPGPVCLASHPDDVQACSSPVQSSVPALGRVDLAVAREARVDYVDTTPWFCTEICSPIIGQFEVYDVSGVHISGPWATYLQNVVAQSLALPLPSPSR